jgi:hypothetical protein
MKYILLGLLLTISTGLNAKAFDFILDSKLWICSQYAVSFKWEKVKVDHSNVYQYYISKTKSCVKYERVGSV